MAYKTTLEQYQNICIYYADMEEAIKIKEEIEDEIEKEINEFWESIKILGIDYFVELFDVYCRDQAYKKGINDIKEYHYNKASNL